MTQSIWDKAGAWFLGIVARWIFKIGAGIFMTLGIEQSKVEMWIGAIVTFLIGALITKVQNKYLKNLTPPAK